MNSPNWEESRRGCSWRFEDREDSMNSPSLGMGGFGGFGGGRLGWDCVWDLCGGGGKALETLQRFAELFHGSGLDLADALPSDTEGIADVLERLLVSSIEAEARGQDAALTGIEL